MTQDSITEISLRPQNQSKILIYCVEFYPTVGGYSKAFYNFAKSLLEADQALEIHVLTPTSLGNHPQIKEPRLQVFRLSKSWLTNSIKGFRFLTKQFRVACNINRLNKKYNYDLIILESLEEPLVSYFLPPSILRKVLARVHATSETEYAIWVNTLFQTIRRKAIRHCLNRKIKYIAATTEYYLRFVEEFYFDGNLVQSATKRMMVIPNIIENNPITIANLKPPPSNRLRLVCLGRMNNLGCNQKGFYDLIMAVSFMPQILRARLEIIIIGNGSERKTLMSTSQKIKDCSIKFYSNLSNEQVLQQIKCADCIALTSRYEGLSMFALESINMGLPILCSSAGGLIDICKDNAFRFIAGRIDSLTEALIDFASSTAADRKYMAQRSKEIAKFYHSDIQGPRLVNMIQGLIEDAK